LLRTTFNRPRSRASRIRLGAFGALLGLSGLAAIVASAGGSALAAGTPGSVVGNPVNASIVVESATGLTLSGSPLAFSDDTGYGGTHTATENYTVATNDANGYYSEVAGDTTDLPTSTFSDFPSSACGATGGPAAISDTPAFMSAASPDGFLDAATATCSSQTGGPGGGGTWVAHNFIPWSALTLTAQAGTEAGVPQPFVSTATGGPQGTYGGTTWLAADSKSSASAAGGDSYADIFSLTVPSGQAAGTYLADIWYGIYSN
jgi:hypothetical protein